MTGTELVTAPRERFAERFALLYAEAGNPPLKAVTESVLRAREVDRGQPVRVPAQRISDWRRGRNVPARFAGLAVVLRVLIGEARKRRADPVVPGLYDLEAWQELWKSALASPLTAASGDGEVVPAGEDVCPYRGLAAFRQTDSHWFFGRERNTEQLLDRLRQAATDGGFVLLVGASGAGKSSLLRAGLGPTLAAGTLPGQDVDWPIVALTPGREPLAELAEHLDELSGPVRSAATALDIGVDPATDRFAQTVREQAKAFAERTSGGTPANEGVVGGGGPEAGVVVVVDQFEELFTLCGDEDSRLLFLRTLHAMCTPGPGEKGAPALVVLGVRADFYDRCLGYPEIVEATQGRQLALGAMTAQGLSDAVVRPARAVGLQLERGLVDLMLTDIGATIVRSKGRVTAAGYDAGALPLLSHALLATWQRRQGGKLTISGYRAAGGIHGAVAATAERVWEGLDDDGKAAAKRILLHLVQVGETTRDVRRRSTRTELLGSSADAGATEQALEVLAAARMVTLDADAVEISHEALLEAWPRLRSWIDDNRTENLLRQRLEADAAAWDGQRREASLLYRGARLESASQLDAVDTTAVATDFLTASRRQDRRARWLRRAGVALVCVLAVIAATAAAIAIDQRDEAEFQQIVTESDNLLPTDPSLAAQLALVAHRIRPEDPDVAGRLLAMQHTPLSTPLRGHSAAVYLTHFRPDGKLLATASEDRTVRLWHVPQQGRPTPAGVIETGDKEWVGTAVFNPNGQVLATAGQDGVIKLWDVRDPAHPKRLGEHLGTPASKGVYLVDFSPDGKMLAAAQGDNAVRLWDVSDPANAKPLGKPLTGHSLAVRTVAFSPDGKLLASGSDDHDVRLWNVADPEHPKPVGKPLDAAGDKVHSAVFSPDGRTLAVGVEDSTVWLWDVSKPARAEPTGPPLTEHEGLVWKVAFSPDGRTLASASADGTTRLWNVANPRAAAPLSRPLTAPGGAVFAVEFSPDGRSLATGSGDAITRFWSQPERLLGAHSEGVGSVAAGPDGLLATGGADHRAQLWRIGPDGRPQAVGKPLPGPGGIVGRLSFGPDLLAVGGDGGSVQLWDISEADQPQRVGPPLKGGNGFLSPDGKLLLTLDGEELRFYDVSAPERPELLDVVASGHDTYVTSATFSTDGKTLATAGFGKTVRLWDVSDPASPKAYGEPIKAHDGTVWALAFNRDGSVLATASEDKTVRRWDTRNARDVRPLGVPLRGHADAVKAVAFSPDGKRLITGSNDKTVRIWRGQSSIQLTGHTGVLEDLAVVPGGFFSGAADGTARLWQLDHSRSIDRICHSADGVLTEQVWSTLIPALDYDPPC